MRHHYYCIVCWQSHGTASKPWVETSGTWRSCDGCGFVRKTNNFDHPAGVEEKKSEPKPEETKKGDVGQTPHRACVNDPCVELVLRLKYLETLMDKAKEDIRERADVLITASETLFGVGNFSEKLKDFEWRFEQFESNVVSELLAIRELVRDGKLVSAENTKPMEPTKEKSTAEKVVDAIRKRNFHLDNLTDEGLVDRFLSYPVGGRWYVVRIDDTQQLEVWGESPTDVALKRASHAGISAHWERVVVDGVMYTRKQIESFRKK